MNNHLFKKNHLFFYKSSKIISNNLRKYQTTQEKYNISIIHSIVFDQKNHIVAEFKNYLLWDETSEFLKRYYKKKESKGRLPKISEYYEKYTLFAPVYFGLNSEIILLMNKFCKRKKKYLEYIEEHEDDYKNINNKNKNKNFVPLIKPELLENSKTNSILTNKTIDLTNYKDNCKLNMSFGELIDNLSISNILKNSNKNKKKLKITLKKKNFTNKRLTIHANDMKTLTPRKNNKEKEFSIETESFTQNNLIRNNNLKTKVIKINKLNFSKINKINSLNKNQDFNQLKSLTERHNIINNIDEPFNYRISRIMQNRINTIPSKETTTFSSAVSNISNNVIIKHSRHNLVLKQEQNDKKDLHNFNKKYDNYCLTPKKNQVKKTKTIQKINLKGNININLDFNIDKNRNSRSIGVSNKKKLLINLNENLDYYPNIYQKQITEKNNKKKNFMKILSIAKTESNYKNLEKLNNYYQLEKKKIINKENKNDFIRKLFKKKGGDIYKG